MSGFSLSEKSCSEIGRFFSGAINDATNNVLTVFKALAEISSKKPYKTVNDRSREFASQYGKEFRNHVLGMLKNWREEGYSIHKFVSNIDGADEDTIKAAYDLEEAMNQCIVAAFQKEPEVYRGSDRLDVDDIEKLFAEIDKVLQLFKKQMGDCIAHTETEYVKKGDSNEVYHVMGAILKGILSSYKSFFDAFGEGMSKNLTSHVSDVNKSAMSAADTSKEQLKVTGENVGELLKGVSSLFQF